MSCKYVLWDWNGTLIDDVGNALMCVNDLLLRKGKKPITLEEYYSYIETPIIGFYYHLFSADEIDKDEIFESFHSDYARHLGDTRLAEGAAAILQKLKENGVKNYIITATHTDEATELTKQYGVYEYLDGIFGADNKYAESKVERARSFFKEQSINPNEAIFIGDSLHDYETANALGIQCVLVSYGHQGRKILENSGAVTVDTLSEAMDIITDERTVDLHTHSVKSDGTKTPSELVAFAKANGLSAIALTDHDSVDGVKEAKEAAKNAGLELIPGIELSAAADAEVHILGLLVDENNEQLLSTVSKLKALRRGRMEAITANLTRLGMAVSYDDALKIAGDKFVGRAHIARVMVNKGYVSSAKEAFEKYIGIGKPAYSYEKRITAREAIEAVKAAGGVAVLAHLNQIGYSAERLEKLLIELKGYGLDGVEGYYTEYTSEETERFRLLASKLGLAFSGGSDYHGETKPEVSIGTGFGNLSVPYQVLDNLKKIKQRNSH